MGFLARFLTQKRFGNPIIILGTPPGFLGQSSVKDLPQFLEAIFFRAQSGGTFFQSGIRILFRIVKRHSARPGVVNQSFFTELDGAIPKKENRIFPGRIQPQVSESVRIFFQILNQGRFWITAIVFRKKRWSFLINDSRLPLCKTVH